MIIDGEGEFDQDVLVMAKKKVIKTSKRNQYLKAWHYTNFTEVIDETTWVHIFQLYSYTENGSHWVIFFNQPTKEIQMEKYLVITRQFPSHQVWVKKCLVTTKQFFSIQLEKQINEWIKLVGKKILVVDMRFFIWPWWKRTFWW